jgi:hypothetical protein
MTAQEKVQRLNQHDIDETVRTPRVGSRREQL